MLRTKYFSDYGSYDDIDFLINEWLGKNPEIRVIDINYQYAVTDIKKHSSVLIVYQTGEMYD